eukprot:107503-Rhodomonas_salina.1
MSVRAVSCVSPLHLVRELSRNSNSRNSFVIVNDWPHGAHGVRRNFRARIPIRYSVQLYRYTGGFLQKNFFCRTTCSMLITAVSYTHLRAHETEADL